MCPAPPDVPALQVRYHDGDDLALSELSFHFRAELERAALRFAGGNDVVAAAGLDGLHKRLQSPDRRATYDPTRPWLPVALDLLRFCVLDVFREHRRREKYGSDEGFHGQKGGAGNGATRLELVDVVRHCLDSLGASRPELCEVIRLRFYEEWDMKDIAVHSGVSQSTAYTRLESAKQELELCLAKQLGGGE